MNQGNNIYSPEDLPSSTLPGGPKVFLSHRSDDKVVVRAIADLLSVLGVHYWLDELDFDLQRAVALGMSGDKAVVHAIERGVQHATVLLGLFTPNTAGSWWVPYEIGYSRASEKPASFLLVGAKDKQVRLPEYARIAAVYGSIDELARWASTLSGHDLHADLTHISQSVFDMLSQYVPIEPSKPDFDLLCENALSSIELLANAEIQSELSLTSDQFNWLPTLGGPIREIAYDLLAPLGYLSLDLPIESHLKKHTEILYQVPTLHYEISQLEPQLTYRPEVSGWRSLRYRTPSQTWLQGLRPYQLDERINLFLTTQNYRGELRLTTKEEFKGEFDRILSLVESKSRRSLGVLINPLFGFTPETRPVFWRILAIEYFLYAQILGRDTTHTPFSNELRSLANRFIEKHFYFN